MTEGALGCILGSVLDVHRVSLRWTRPTEATSSECREGESITDRLLLILSTFQLVESVNDSERRWAMYHDAPPSCVVCDHDGGASWYIGPSKSITCPS